MNSSKVLVVALDIRASDDQSLFLNSFFRSPSVDANPVINRCCNIWSLAAAALTADCQEAVSLESHARRSPRNRRPTVSCLQAQDPDLEL